MFRHFPIILRQQKIRFVGTLRNKCGTVSTSLLHTEQSGESIFFMQLSV